MILINVLGLKHTETETHGWVKSASRKNHYVLRWAFDDVLSPVHISLVGSRFVSIPSPTSIHSFIHSFTFANISSLCLALLMSLLVAVETDRERERGAIPSPYIQKQEYFRQRVFSKKRPGWK